MDIDTIVRDQRIFLSDICPRRYCGQVMTRTVLEQNIVHTCRCGYEAKTITGESKLEFEKVKRGTW